MLLNLATKTITYSGGPRSANKYTTTLLQEKDQDHCPLKSNCKQVKTQ